MSNVNKQKVIELRYCVDIMMEGMREACGDKHQVTPDHYIALCFAVIARDAVDTLEAFTAEVREAVAIAKRMEQVENLNRGAGGLGEM